MCDVPRGKGLEFRGRACAKCLRTCRQDHGHESWRRLSEEQRKKIGDKVALSRKPKADQDTMKLAKGIAEHLLPLLKGESIL